MTDAQTDLTLTIIWIVGTMITLGLGIYALILFRQLKRKQEEAATVIKQRNDELADQIGTIALAMKQEQCDLSEGSIRIFHLIDHLLDDTGNQVEGRQKAYPGIYELYQGIKHLPTHKARLELPKTERMKQDFERWKLEADLKEQISADIESLLETYPASDPFQIVKQVS